MTLSRRTWLWTSTAALAAACTRPGPTMLPTGADGQPGAPEGPRPLTRRGAENLIALAELGAAIRWLHPSDQARRLDWEATLLDGVRSLEAAGSRAELVEGLRGLFGEVAPTVVIWRATKQAESDELDAPACPDPQAEPEDEAKTEDEGKADAKADAAKPDQDTPSRARDPELTKGKGRPPDDPPKPPVRTAPGEPSDRKQAEAATNDAATGTDAPDEASDAAASDAEPSKHDADRQDAKSEPSKKDAKSDAGKQDAKSEPTKKDAKSEPAKQDEDDGDDEPPPPLPEPLFAGLDEPLTITQWFRSGYADDLDDDPGCARRIEHDPARPSVCEPPARRRRKSASDCPPCAAIEAEPLAPAAPLRVSLPRGLASLVPLALWTRAGQTLPSADGSDLAAPFDAATALAYTLEDRGARLLSVLRTHALLQRFFPHARADGHERLTQALCAAAEEPSPIALRATLERLLAGFADGNAELIVASGKAARRWLPALTLAWIEQRVVVVRSELDAVRPGDVVTAIDGASIDDALAQRRARTPAASASAAIVRTVAGLLEREQADARIELVLLRTSDEGERELSVTARAELRSDRAQPLADLRPARPIVELDGDHLYLDAARLPRLDAAARRARRAARVLVDLRGELADPRGSLLAHFIAEPLVLALERAPTGPTPAGELPLEPIGERRVEADGPRSRAQVIVLADARTRGRAELELLGFDRLGATIVGSASAGDLGGVATAWLPGGWQLRFTHTELRRSDGEALWGRGVSPSVFVEPTLAAVAVGEDPLVTAALRLGSG